MAISHHDASALNTASGWILVFVLDRNVLRVHLFRRRFFESDQTFSRVSQIDVLYVSELRLSCLSRHVFF